MIKRQAFQSQASLFIISGGLQYCLDFLIFSTLLLCGVSPLLASIASRSVAACLGFIFNGLFVFKSLRGSSPTNMLNTLVKFLLLLTTMTLLSTLLLTFSLSLFGHSHLNASLSKLAIEFSLAVASFLIQKFHIFNRRGIY